MYHYAHYMILQNLSENDEGLVCLQKLNLAAWVSRGHTFPSVRRMPVLVADGLTSPLQVSEALLLPDALPLDTQYGVQLRVAQVRVGQLHVPAILAAGRQIKQNMVIQLTPLIRNSSGPWKSVPYNTYSELVPWLRFMNKNQFLITWSSLNGGLYCTLLIKWMTYIIFYT